MVGDFILNCSIGIIIVEVLVCVLIDGLFFFGNVLVFLVVICSLKLCILINMFIFVLVIVDIFMVLICIFIICGIFVLEVWINISVFCDI